MANNTLFGLYDKYRNKIGHTLENDGYYQYLMELLQGSEVAITQTNRILHKEVDERWLVAMEEAIPAITTVITRPRSFIKSVETLVPIELARKISSESVRHLSQNTQNITGMQGDMVMPGKILNVSSEESFDLYENRFVGTLIRKLAAFIDKRIDIMFWQTGDERQSILKIDSGVEDDYEQIEYKLEMVIKNKQSYLENDAAQMETFKRIDRVRRIVGEFKRSKFMAQMSDTSPVRSPIQRTNLIMKEPSYRKCFNLWKFLEDYDDVGYSVDIKDTALDFDEDYIYQMYTNIAMNYTVFKTILDSDPRRIEDAPAKRRKVVKPKFIKKIVEEIVDDYDIPDVEIRRVIVEEITKAQAEIEKRRAEKEKAAEKLKREKEREAARRAKEAEKKKAAKERERLAAQRAKEQERQRLAREKELAKAKAEREKELERARIEKEKQAAIAKAEREKELEKARIEKEKQAAIAKAEREKELEKARIEKEKERAKAKAEREKELERVRIAKAKELERQKSEKQKAKELERQKAAKIKEKEKLAREKQAAMEKAKKAKELERQKALKIKEKAKAQKSPKPKKPVQPEPVEQIEQAGEQEQ